MEKTNKAFLKHILDAIRQIEEYTEELTFEQFSQNRLIQDGVIREIEIIGEATKNLSREFIKQYSDIPWRDIADMRNKLIHGYFGVDLKIVWKTVKQDVPELKENVERILKDKLL